jgi:hypothetical protein
MDYGARIAEQAQQWHETDHGCQRGEPIKGDKFKQPREDDVPATVPDDFRECSLCKPSASDRALAPHVNPFWYRVLAWETES